MPGDLDHVSSGQSFSPTAETWNAFVDAAVAHRDQKLGRAGGNPNDRSLIPSTRCRVKYDASSVSTLSAFSVLSYGSALIDPSANSASRLFANRSPTFTGATPTAATIGRPFVVTATPIQGGTLGEAISHGLAVVQVEITSAAHTRAKPIAGSTAKLTSCASGGVPIVWSESGTGTKWAIVLLDFSETEASDPACKSFLSLPECATLEVVEAYGACACITTGQTASLTRSGAALASDDLLYGCPPGVTTATNCDGGSAPRKYSFTLSGLTGACSVMNGGWTVTYTTGNTWVGTKGGYTATLTFGSAISGFLTFTDSESSEVLVYTIEDFDCCSTITTFERDSWTCDDPPASVTLTPATACGNGPAYTPYLSLETDTCGDCLRLLWIPVAGSGAASIRWKMIGCGVDGDGKRYAEFASASPLICTDDAEECGENYVVVRVTCDLCANPDYDGAGFYCVDGECTFLAEDPGNGVVITTGKFEAAEDCFCNPSDMPGTCLDVGHPDLPLEVCASLALYSGSDNLGIDGLTVPLTFFYFVNGDGDGSYGYRWTGSYPVLPQGSCTQVEMISMGFGGTVSGGVPSCTLSMFLGSGNFAYFVEAACYATDLDPAVGTTSADIEFADANLVWEFATAMDAGQTVGGVQETTGSATGTKYDAILSPTTCDLSPPVASYNCVNGSCVEVYDGSGEHATLAECAEACTGGGGGGSSFPIACCPDMCGQTVTLTIVGGADEGEYTATLNCTATASAAHFVVGSSLYTARCNGNPGEWSLVKYTGSSNTGNGTASAPDCDPFAVVFDYLFGFPSGTTSITLT